MERTCTQCGQAKPQDEFHRAAHGRQGRAAECKTCHAARSAKPLDRSPVLTCLNCGTEFPNPARRGPDRKFCTARCKDKWWQAEYQRRRQGNPLRPCKRCGGPVAHKTGLPICQACRVDNRSRPYRRATIVKSRYGLTQDGYDALLAQQGGRCAICRADSPGSWGDWRVDHDAVTGKVRGLLCDGCNKGIGCLQHDPDVIAAALRYLQRHRQMQLSGPERPKLRAAAGGAS